MLADVVRADAASTASGGRGSPQAEGIKVLARTHKTLIWDRTT